MKKIIISSIVAFLAAAAAALAIQTSLIEIKTLLFVCVFLLVWMVSYSAQLGALGPLTVRNNLAKANLQNSTGNPPYLLWVENCADIRNGMILHFWGAGIPLSVWEDKRAALESALNIFVLKIRHGKDRRHVDVYAVAATHDLPDMIPWNDAYLINDDFTLMLGESLTGAMTVQLAVVPHMLIGGSTGSGKTVLIKLLARQCIKKGASVYIIDPKKVDFSSFANMENCHLLNSGDLGEVEKLLLELLNECKSRQDECARHHGITDIQMYNAYVRDTYRRIIIVIDELAEILDKKRFPKAQHTRIDNIIGYLSTIACTGRAFGVHLILGTQRPDATVVPGQIKDNISFKCCGRAENILSQIILDDARASELIPADAQGLFVCNDPDKTVFRAYYWDNRHQR